ncbi:zinc-dependent alcohol dehydrogenase family protein [Paenibacillus kobensis]|uniref:zinc-dependent alcohol dehydrogenase family protein n=1 Tax=Paenibacillus kobensis TaxID=59841 RepID=UPI000FD9C437|nr:zinc-dependent alcohol dehydrogenase family protein [Paenibacillus kobensis]
MKAAVLEQFNQPLVVREVADPTLTPDGIILKLEATGVCRSDWHGWAGHMKSSIPALPHILGHEMSGVIEEVGSNIRNFKKGDRVIVPFSQGDGTCPHCQAGHHNVCDNMKMVGFNFEGGFAQYVHIPNADLNLLHLADEIDFLTASAMGCRFMTAFHGVISRGGVRPGEWVAVYGSGGVGLSAIQIASAAGANVIAVDIADDKLDFAKKFGAVATVNSKNENAPQAIKELTKGGANISIDALGIQDTVLSSIMSLNKRGRHVQIGISPNPNGGMTPVPVNLIMMNEISVLGSVSMPIPEYRNMLNMVGTGKLKPGALVTKQIALDDINTAFDDMTNFAGFGLTVVTKF